MSKVTISFFGEKAKTFTFNEYQKLASRTIKHDFSLANCEDHALHGMAGEVGELHSIYQKVYQGHDFDLDHAKKEVGDLLWFIAEWCTGIRVNMNEIAQMNIEKLNGFDIEHSLHRAQGDI